MNISGLIFKKRQPLTKHTQINQVIVVDTKQVLPWQHANKVYCLNYILLDAERQTPFNPDAMDIERKQNLG